MCDKEDYLTSYRLFFENFAANVNHEDQLPVQIAGYTITDAELPGEVLNWTTQYLSEKQCPQSLMIPLCRIILDEVRTASKKQPNDFGYNSDESVFTALRLMQAVTARVNAICLRYLDNSKLDSLPPPLCERRTTSAAIKNSRRVMEDRHVEISNLEALFGIETSEPTSFYAVYDGHAGSAAAIYCAAHLHQYLCESPHFKTDLKRALYDSFIRTDAQFVRKSNEERACGGSTAVVIAIRGHILHAAWVGDSQALLAKRMRLMQLVHPHKPSRQDEKDRIEASGGTVIHWGTWRVNGQLAVSRAIGDAQYKPFVTAKPELESVYLDGDEDFIVVACDGLWDVVSEDEVALSIYRQIIANSDDLKAVTKRLIVQAKRQGSTDNISVIVVFLKEPRKIADDNCEPMDLGVDNALANAPAFGGADVETCKRLLDAADMCTAADGEADGEAEGVEPADNGIEHSDSDSEDLGPETAVDIDVDVDDADGDNQDGLVQPPTPPAHQVHAGESALVDNVAESGEESEDEWNYFKGERNANEETKDKELPQRAQTPGQDNSAWESSSGDMNSSPLNPDAPVFVPGTAGSAASDVLLAESPRKPLPMDDIELPDNAEFQNEAVGRPADILDLDNCDQFNGHLNSAMATPDKNSNGNEKCNMESLGFGFNVGIDTGKESESSLVKDFERIQKDTTDFCNVQVSYAQAASDAADIGIDEELFERLKNKERDPMSMSFYQEKDDDTSEPVLPNDAHVDLNAVQLLPDSEDEEDNPPNGLHTNVDDNKENMPIEEHIQLGLSKGLEEPDNNILRSDERIGITVDNMVNFDQENNEVIGNFANVNTPMMCSNLDFHSGNATGEAILQTDTPESHKLLFEQIPEIPDGKVSELDFGVENPFEAEKETALVTAQEHTSTVPETLDNIDFLIGDRQTIPSSSELEDQEENTKLSYENITNLMDHKDEIMNPEFIIDTVRSVGDIEQSSAEVLHLAVSPVTNEENMFMTESKIINPFMEQEFSERPKSREAGVTAQTNNDIMGFVYAESEEEFGNKDAVGVQEQLDEIDERGCVNTELKLQTDFIEPQVVLPATQLFDLDNGSKNEELMNNFIFKELPTSPLPEKTEYEKDPEISAVITSNANEIKEISSKKDYINFEANELRPVVEQFFEEKLVSNETSSSSAIPDIVPELSSDNANIKSEIPSEMITDLDVGIKESRAQEICEPVTDEVIPINESIVEDNHVADTPPPTPALEPSAPKLEDLISNDEISLTSPAAEEKESGNLPKSEDSKLNTAAVTAIAAGTAVVAATAAAIKSKTPAIKKSQTVTKSPATAVTKTTLKPSTPTAISRPTSAKKATPTSTTLKASAPLASPTKTPTSAGKPSPASISKVSASTKLTTKPATTKTTLPTKSQTKTATNAPKDASAAPKPTAPVKTAPVAKPAPRPPVTKSAPTLSKTSTMKTTLTSKPSATSVSSRSATTAPARPAPKPTTTAAKPPTTTKPPEKKPLTNGDVRAPIKKSASSTAPATKPPVTKSAQAPKPAGAPRPPPRASAPTTVSTTAITNKAAAPKPAPRSALRPPLDKQSKDLANKRITAKTAPSRTTTAKVPVTKTEINAIKAVKKPVTEVALTNGSDEPEMVKSQITPADNALLPDVIA